MAERSLSKLAGLLLAAAAAWAAPWVGVRAKQLFSPAATVFYEQNRRLFWSPADNIENQWEIDGNILDQQSKPSGSIDGWQGLLLGHPLNLNAANSQDLEALPGIGPKMAEAILQNREENGSFKKVEDLERIGGIGPKTMERLRPWLAVSTVRRVDAKK